MNEKLIKLLLDYDNSCDIKLLRKILLEYAKNGLSINSLFCGYALLHKKQPYENVKLLLDRGADPNVSGICNVKPIHLYYNCDCIKLLVKHGARPSPLEDFNLNPLFWQKDYHSFIYLLNYNELYNTMVLPDQYIRNPNLPYYRMIIEGGYDPFSESNIITSPVFLQRNIDTFSIIITSVFYDYDMFKNTLYDIVNENILFKPCITKKHIIRIKYYLGIKEKNILVNHQNIIGNTPLHVQYNYDNIKALLTIGADTNIMNDDGLTPYNYHLERNNLKIANYILKYSSAKKIQENWRSFWFKKTYISPKYYKIKKEFLEDFIYLSPSECHTFPGGIEYQKAHKEFLDNMNYFINPRL